MALASRAMRRRALFLVSLLLAASGCIGKFRDADHVFEERIGQPPAGEHTRVFTFQGVSSSETIRIKADFKFESWTEIVLANEHQGRLWNQTFPHPDVWEWTEEWASPRNGKDWSGAWTFTLKTQGPARYAFGFYFD